MGIPKFYRWTSERYPCLSEIIKEYQIPEFDNLYLDMNGIIHNCSHPNDEDVHLRISERQIFKDIFHYIEFLFKMIKPCKVFFMAIDGVAPRAKMNQQRGRRFRSARIAEEQEAEALQKGEVLPSEERFDSNCITPGTEFMARLHEQLKYFVQVKVTTDPLWQREGLVVYLSGHDVPGEGEHKIMDFIRHIRSKPSYDPMTRHCLYGLDADLVMLGLSTHELQFSLLREEVKFTRAKKPKKGLKHPPKQNQGTANYDLTNVSIFKHDSSSGGPSDSILRPPQAQISFNVSKVKEGTSFSQALESVPAVQRVTEVKNPTSLQSSAEKSEDKPPTPPPANDAGVTGAYKAPLPEKTTFLLLHLSLMRDYIDFEFQDLKETLDKSDGPVKYDLEKLIDDWILMNILVGNDFVPHLPHLHIVKGALPMLYKTYMEILPKLDGYLNENGILNLQRFEVFIKKLSQFDIELFRETYDDMKYMESKTGKNIVLGEKMFELEGFDFDDGGVVNFEEEELEPLSPELKALAQRTEAEVFGETKSESGGKLCAEVFCEDDDYFDKEDSDEMKLEFLQHKRNYYISKLHVNEISSEFLKMYCCEYIRAIQWVLLYYYKGVSSWGWFYPFHYAPFASDLKSFTNFKIEFDKGQPFKPFEQLLAVLPSQSRKLLPKCYQWLMTEKDSPILDFYPEKFEQDLNGKKADWEAVVLIPFIDEGKLLTVMENEVLNLSTEEAYRNSRGTMMCYSYTEKDNGPIVSPRDLFPTLPSSHANIVQISEVTYDPALLPKGIHPEAKRTTIYQGFPTLKSKPVKCVIEKAEIKVFEFVTREESMILSLENVSDECADIWSLARKLLGKSVWVNWPHLTFAYVTGILTREGKVIEDNGRILKDLRFEESRAEKEFNTISKSLVTRHLKCKGIKLGNLNVIIYAKMMEGRKVRCDSKGSVDFQTQWSALEQPFALKTCVYEENVTEIFYLDRTLAKSYLDMYRKGDHVFYLGDKLFGTLGTVIGHDEAKSSVLVSLEVPSRGSDEFNLKNLIGQQELKSHDYFNSYTAAGKCQISSYVLSRITGTVFISVEKESKSSRKLARSLNKRNKQLSLAANNPESSSWSDSSSDEEYPALEMKKVNVGLDLKFNKKNLEVRGYTSKRDGQWYYSGKAIQLVNDYVERFHDFIQALTRYEKGVDVYNAADLFKSDALSRVNEMVEWLEQRGVRDLTRIPTNTKLLDDDDIDAVWKYILANKSSNKNPVIKKWTVRPNLLLKPGLDRGCVTPVPNSRFDMLDRIICVDRGAPVQVGHRGTIVGIQTPNATEPEQIEESFKSTGAATLMTLIVLVDPTPGIFDKSEDYGVADRAVEKLSNSLASMLGVSKETPAVNEVSRPILSQPELTTRKPRLIKLYPYQVINLSQGASILRESHRVTKQVNKMNVGNGFLPITRENETQLMKNIPKKTLPDANKPVRILTRPALSSSATAVKPQQGKKNPLPVYDSQSVHESRRVASQQQHPTPLMQILQPLNRPVPTSSNSNGKVAWPPQPMKLTPVEQFFSAAALAQQSSLTTVHGADKGMMDSATNVRSKKKDSPQKQSAENANKNAALTASLEKMLSSSTSKRQNQNVSSLKKPQQKETLQQQPLAQQQSAVPQGTQDLVQLLNQGFQQYESRDKNKQRNQQQRQQERVPCSFTVYNQSVKHPQTFRRDNVVLEKDNTSAPVAGAVAPFGGLPTNLPNIPVQWLPEPYQRRHMNHHQQPPANQHHPQHYYQMHHQQQYQPLPMYHGDPRGFRFPNDRNNAFAYPGNGQFQHPIPPAAYAPTSFVPTQVARKQAQGQGKIPPQESLQQPQGPPLHEAKQNHCPSLDVSISSGSVVSTCTDTGPKKSRIAANFGMSH